LQLSSLVDWWSSRYDLCLAAGLNLGGFCVIAGGLCAQVFRSSLITHLAPTSVLMRWCMTKVSALKASMRFSMFNFVAASLN